MSKQLNEKQTELLGKSVVAIKEIDYGYFKIDMGREGVIYDFFSSESDYPCIRWSEDFTGFVKWDSVKLVD